MTILITVIHVIVCIFLIAVVLLQSGKSADIAAAFGGMGSQTAFGTRTAATVLSKATTWAAIIFMLTSITLYDLRRPSRHQQRIGAVRNNLGPDEDCARACAGSEAGARAAADDAKSVGLLNNVKASAAAEAFLFLPQRTFYPSISAPLVAEPGVTWTSATGAASPLAFVAGADGALVTPPLPGASSSHTARCARCRARIPAPCGRWRTFRCAPR